MRYFALILLSITLFSCPGNLSPEELFESCPYEHKYGSGAHYLVTPINMIPHQMIYKVGDTLTVRMDFSDTILDLAKDIEFFIEDFPFEPVTTLYRIKPEGWDSGYRVNELLVEEKFKPRFNSHFDLADDMRGFALYEDGRYKFEYKLVFETPGNYCTLITDQYVENLGVFASQTNAEANAIEFEGKCPGAEFLITSIIEGDAHYDEYIKELEYLDKQVFRDRLSRPDNVDNEIFGTGHIPIDWTGVYCFTVEE